jgi:hypothetical protein
MVPAPPWHMPVPPHAPPRPARRRLPPASSWVGNAISFVVECRRGWESPTDRPTDRPAAVEEVSGANSGRAVGHEEEPVMEEGAVVEEEEAALVLVDERGVHVEDAQVVADEHDFPEEKEQEQEQDAVAKIAQQARRGRRARRREGGESRAGWRRYEGAAGRRGREGPVGPDPKVCAPDGPRACPSKARRTEPTTRPNRRAEFADAGGGGGGGSYCCSGGSDGAARQKSHLASRARSCLDQKARAAGDPWRGPSLEGHTRCMLEDDGQGESDTAAGERSTHDAN